MKDLEKQSCTRGRCCSTPRPTQWPHGQHVTPLSRTKQTHIRQGFCSRLQIRGRKVAVYKAMVRADQ